MRTIFKGFLGAAMLLGASAASAQDYTWTLSDFWFDRHGPTAPWNNTGDLGQASGTLVLTKVGADYELKSFNFTTTLGESGLTAIYDYDQNDTYSTNPLAFNTFIEMDDIDGEKSFRIVWYDSGLADEMNSNNIGAVVDLDGNQSYEYEGSVRRYNGTGQERCVLDANFTEICNDTTAGVMTLTSVTNVPEPASMAIMGAGLLGLLAARRRRRTA